MIDRSIETAVHTWLWLSGITLKALIKQFMKADS